MLPKFEIKALDTIRVHSQQFNFVLLIWIFVFRFDFTRVLILGKLEKDEMKKCYLFDGDNLVSGDQLQVN